MASALGYGAKTHGASDQEWRNATRLLRRNAPPYAKVAAEAKAVIAGNLAWTLAFAPVSAWHDEVWANISGSASPKIRLGELIGLWHQARPNDAEKWSKLAGPLQNAALSLKRLGWKWPKPLVMKNDFGETINLEKFFPAMLKWHAKAAVERYHCKRGSQNFAQRIPIENAEAHAKYDGLSEQLPSQRSGRQTS